MSGEKSRHGFLQVAYLGSIAGGCFLFFWVCKWALVPLGALILLNAWLSFRWIWKERPVRVLLLSVFQLLLFTVCFRLLYLLGGPGCYDYTRPPQLWDWLEFTSIHVLRAADFMDAIEGYGWQIQNIRSRGYLSGTPVVLLHLLVDFFLFTAFYKLFLKKGVLANLVKKLTSIVVILAGCGALALAGWLLWNMRTHYVFLIWEIICAMMLLAIAKWPSSGWQPDLKGNGEAFGCLIPIAIAVVFFKPEWTVNFFIAIAIGLVALLVIYIFLSVQALFVFLPLLAFTLLFWIGVIRLEKSSPGSFQGEIDFSLFALDNLFRSLDLLDMTQVYRWNWSGGGYRGWIVGSVVVSYRFLASTYFYRYLYKLLALWNAGKIISLDKKMEMLLDLDQDVALSVESELRQSRDKNVLFRVLCFLQEDDPSRKRLALDICRSIGGVEVIPHLTPLLLEKEWREEAREILQQFPSKEIRPHLLPFLDNKESRIKAIRAIAKLDIKEAAADVAQILGDSNSDVVFACIEALVELNAQQEVPAIILLLQSPQKKIRMEAARALGEMQADTAVSGIIALLEDQDESLREMAALSLGQLASPNAVPGLLSLLQNGGDDAKIAAMDALWRMRESREAPKVANLLNSKNAKVCAMALQALGHLGATEEIPKIRHFLKDEQYKGIAAKALGRLGDKDSISQIADMLSDKSASADALEALLMLGVSDRLICSKCYHSGLARMGDRCWCSWCQSWTRAHWQKD